MKKITYIIFFSLFYLFGISQGDFKVYHEIKITETNRIYQMGHLIKSEYEIINDGKGKLFYGKHGAVKETMQKSMPTNMVIRIKELEGEVIKDIVVDYNDIDIDLSGFGVYYLGQRSFLIYKLGRYKFGILNLSNFKTIGPISPEVQGERGDSQDGSLNFGTVFGKGQYILGYSWGMGMFCYNLMDLYNPKQVESFCVPNSNIKGGSLFLDKRTDSVFNAIYAEMPKIGLIDSIYFVFQGKSFEVDSNNEISKNVIHDRYLLLKEIKAEDHSVPFAIDFSNGNILSEREIQELEARKK